ncbi:MAG: carbohydrate kinase [Bacteroidetes bacterium]|nr:carbohydrate kinase [Bacteroidota bacterium]
MILRNILQSFENQCIIVVGDVMLDRYLTGNISRISPEAPVPVLEWGSEENRLGGAANVALNLAALGAVPVLCSVTGKDAESGFLSQLMEQEGLIQSGMVASGERVTTVKTRVIAGTQHLLRLDKEQTNELSNREASAFLSNTLELLASEKFDAMVFQDYNKGVLTEEVIKTLMGEAKQRKIPVAVDPKFRNFWCYQGADLFKPNLKEVNDALRGKYPPDEISLQSAARLMRQKLHNGLTIITLSERGVFLDDGVSGKIYPTQPRLVADVCGAGDTVISVAALAMAAGLDLDEIALLANLAGGQVVEKVGVVPVDKAQLQAELLQAAMHKA